MHYGRRRYDGAIVKMDPAEQTYDALKKKLGARQAKKIIKQSRREMKAALQKTA